MRYASDVLQALLRVSRRRRSPTLTDLVFRTGLGEDDVRRALFALARGGLVQRTPAGLHLTLAGLAVGTAAAAGRAGAKAAHGARAKALPRRLPRRRHRAA
jgi:DNA-binding IclR family transcriptional regulator